MKLHSALGIFTAAAAMLFTQAATSGVLYLNDGDGHRLYAINTATGQQVNSWTANPSGRSFPIAVYGDVRTTGYYPGETGALYNLAGAYQGSNYTLQSLSQTLSDGTTDGTYNYGVSWSNGEVFRFDRNWANGVSQFTAKRALGGISYDSRDGTFWLSGDRTSGIDHYSATGQLLGSFATPEVSSMDWDLAFDPGDKTLWISQAFAGTTTFYQYATTGQFLGSTNFNVDRASSFFSAEFDLGGGGSTVPEPGSLSLAAVSLAIVAALRRRKNPSA